MSETGLTSVLMQEVTRLHQRKSKRPYQTLSRNCRSGEAEEDPGKLQRRLTKQSWKKRHVDENDLRQLNRRTAQRNGVLSHHMESVKMALASRPGDLKHLRTKQKLPPARITHGKPAKVSRRPPTILALGTRATPAAGSSHADQMSSGTS